MWWAAAGVMGLGVALAAPEWLPSAWTAEDGIIETATFGCLLVAGLLALATAWRLRPDRRAVIVAVAIGGVLIVAAGEEISWGQRLFHVDTPAVLVDGNRQDELNLHNLDGLQRKAVIAQLAIAGIGVILPRFVDRRWARAGVPFFAGYLAYRAARGVAAVANWAPAGDNAEAAEWVLAAGLLAATLVLYIEHARPPAGYATRGSHRGSRPVKATARSSGEAPGSTLTGSP